ncbi:GTP-binding protein [Synechococcus sp. KORDI-52]|uniref:GTP-binding protein n=1 Tax=Synechococcus sp. KORDI-52 TaxID=585425 RepID=UPI0005700022|nr:GTP-binding protein [Synechococcus sp. KORDI-52]
MSGMQPTPPHTVERCQLLLERWQSQLQLSPRERGLLGGELQLLNRQLQRLQQRRLRVALFGRVGVGKSSLINALIRRPLLKTDVANGSTRRQQAVDWPVEISGLTRVELVDTPGIDEIDAAGRARLASRVAMGADLVLLVVDSDLTRADLEALGTLLDSGKPLQLVLNRSDRWPEHERAELLRSIRARLPADLPITAAAAAPRRPQLQADGRVRSTITAPRVQELRQQLCQQLENEGTLLLAIQSLRQADRFQGSCQQLRLQQHRRTAQSLIGRYAAAKATGVAVNPVMALDMAGGIACDTALVLQLSRLYNLPMTPAAARVLLTRLSSHNALLGGVQLGLAALKQALLLLVPVSGGGSLAPAAPVALAQAALAVHASRQTGRLVAQQLLRRRGGQPGALLQRLAERDPVVHHWLLRWPKALEQDLQPLLP